MHIFQSQRMYINVNFHSRDYSINISYARNVTCPKDNSKTSQDTSRTYVDYNRNCYARNLSKSMVFHIL